MFSRRLVSSRILTASLQTALTPITTSRFLSTVPKSTVRTSATRNFSTSPSKRYPVAAGGPRPPPQKLPVVPLVLIFLLGSGAFAYMVNSRKDQMPTIKKGSSNAPVTTAFDPAKVTVVYVLGGPGAGKGTQCANLVRDYGFVHLSAGDLLRAEQQRPGSEFGELIKTYIREGKIVPMEVTVALLQNAMTEALSQGKPARFLIDGFPRQIDQARKFEDEVCPCQLTLFFDCPEDVLEKRLLIRGQTSGRIDDNIDSIKKRFKTFVDTSMPVIDMFEKEGKVVKIYAGNSVEDVYKNVKAILNEKLGLKA